MSSGRGRVGIAEADYAQGQLHSTKAADYSVWSTSQTGGPGRL